MTSWKNISLGLCLSLLVVSTQGCALLAVGAAGGAGYAIATGAQGRNFDQPIEYVYQATHRALKK